MPLMLAMPVPDSVQAVYEILNLQELPPPVQQRLLYQCWSHWQTWPTSAGKPVHNPRQIHASIQGRFKRDN